MRRFGDLQSHRDLAVESYADAVRNGTFPQEDTESYKMDKDEWTKFLDRPEL